MKLINNKTWRGGAARRSEQHDKVTTLIEVGRISVSQGWSTSRGFHYPL